MPGFVAAVNASITVSDEATELYYINYLYGFLVSAAVHTFLHWAVPDRKFDAFVKDGTPAREIQALYNGHLDVIVGQGGEQGPVGEAQRFKGVDV
jgi:NCS1 family nucleobase:cation symporter-1